ncbi:hypothetical protein [Chelativorans sp. AA-79]|uniref:hypothetical protein n=1 Tax=Chelativorans sp. AA-79 TaxID=3028735 RepID=UPI0023F85309|nr:hypothetical protein [Chelativorans sp. AA-79]WEX07909.1 hypothetical protein PVE73_17650 [Chelativorans sp. AA-79]
MPARSALSRVHAAAGMFAFALISTFLAASACAETSADPVLIAAVKRAIAWALLLLVPALIATGGSGFAMVGGRPAGLAAVKFRRMRIVAGNGLLVLVPAALYLAWKAGQGAFDTGFVVVQAIEFVAGGTNLLFMGLNIRDGLAMTRRRRMRPAGSGP